MSYTKSLYFHPALRHEDTEEQITLDYRQGLYAAQLFFLTRKINANLGKYV